jgi:fucose permease
MMHVIWSAGATVGPFIIRPFLVPLPPSSVATATTVNATVSDYTTSLFTSSPWTADEDSSSVSIYSNSSSAGDVIVPDVSQLKYAFIIMGLIGMLPTVCFIYAFFAYTPRTLGNAARVRRSRDDDQSEGQGETDAALQQTDDTDNGSRNHGNPPRSYLMLVYVVIALCFSSYLIVELTPGTLLGLFVVDGLGWEATSVSPVMSTFWGFHCLGRLVGVPVSMVLSPAPMLTINFVILFVAFSLMFAGALFSDWLVWISIAGSAFGMASTFATGVLLAAQYIPFGGTAASVVIVAASVGGAAGPPLATFLFATFGHMTFVYLLLAATSFSALSFALLYFLLRTSRSKRWTKKTNKI